MKTTDAARGKWPRILQEFGIDPEVLDHKHHPCPCDGGGEDRFRFSDQNGTGDYFCACSQGGKGGFGLLECKTGRAFKDLANEVDTMIGNNSTPSEPRMQTYAEKLRAVAKPSTRSAYLQSRGLTVPPSLLFARGVEYWDDGKLLGKHDAMLAPVTRNGEWQTFHATYLENGKKADVPCSRKVLPGGPISGAGIELYPAEEEMGVAEGIETAIAAHIIFDCPVHATISAGGMGNWVPPSIAKLVHIFADNDQNFAGAAGAYKLAHRLAMLGIQVIVHAPKVIGQDWNDVLLHQQAAA